MSLPRPNPRTFVALAVTSALTFGIQTPAAAQLTPESFCAANDFECPDAYVIEGPDVVTEGGPDAQPVEFRLMHTDDSGLASQVSQGIWSLRGSSSVNPMREGDFAGGFLTLEEVAIEGDALVVVYHNSPGGMVVAAKVVEVRQLDRWPERLRIQGMPALGAELYQVYDLQAVAELKRQAGDEVVDAEWSLPAGLPGVSISPSGSFEARCPGPVEIRARYSEGPITVEGTFTAGLGSSQARTVATPRIIAGGMTLEALDEGRSVQVESLNVWERLPGSPEVYDWRATGSISITDAGLITVEAFDGGDPTPSTETITVSRPLCGSDFTYDFMVEVRPKPVQRIHISAPGMLQNSFSSGESIALEAEAEFEDGTRRVIEPAWSVRTMGSGPDDPVESALGASVDPSGHLQTAPVTCDRNLLVEATWRGVTGGQIYEAASSAEIDEFSFSSDRADPGEALTGVLSLNGPACGDTEIEFESAVEAADPAWSGPVGVLTTEPRVEGSFTREIPEGASSVQLTLSPTIGGSDDLPAAHRVTLTARVNGDQRTFEFIACSARDVRVNTSRPEDGLWSMPGLQGRFFAVVRGGRSYVSECGSLPVSISSSHESVIASASLDVGETLDVSGGLEASIVSTVPTGAVGPDDIAVELAYQTGQVDTETVVTVEAGLDIGIGGWSPDATQITVVPAPTTSISEATIYPLNSTTFEVLGPVSQFPEVRLAPDSPSQSGITIEFRTLGTDTHDVSIYAEEPGTFRFEAVSALGVTVSLPFTLTVEPLPEIQIARVDPETVTLPEAGGETAISMQGARLGLAQLVRTTSNSPSASGIDFELLQPEASTRDIRIRTTGAMPGTYQIELVDEFDRVLVVPLEIEVEAEAPPKVPDVEGSSTSIPADGGRTSFVLRGERQEHWVGIRVSPDSPGRSGVSVAMGRIDGDRRSVRVSTSGAAPGSYGFDLVDASGGAERLAYRIELEAPASGVSVSRSVVRIRRGGSGSVTVSGVDTSRWRRARVEGNPRGSNRLAFSVRVRGRNELQLTFRDRGVRPGTYRVALADRRGEELPIDLEVVVPSR